jgi:hypothetical protein
MSTIDIRYHGVASGVIHSTRFETVGTIVATPSQLWSLSTFAKIIAQPSPPVAYNFRVESRDASGATLLGTTTTPFTPTSSLLRYQLPFTLSANVSTARALPLVGFTLVNGASYDFTIRIGWPQMETGSVATSPIATAGSTVARSADVVSLTGASSLIGQTRGAFYAEFEYRDIPIVRSGPLYIRQALVRGLGISFAPGGAGLQVVSRNNAGQTAITIVAGALQIGTLYKVAVVYDAGATALGGTQVNGITCFVNGVSVATGDFRVPDTALLNEVRLYGSNTGAGADIDPFNGSIRSVALFPTTITSSQAISITTL